MFTFSTDIQIFGLKNSEYSYTFSIESSGVFSINLAFKHSIKTNPTLIVTLNTDFINSLCIFTFSSIELSITLDNYYYIEKE